MAIPTLEIEITADPKEAEAGFGRIGKALKGVDAATEQYQQEVNDLNRAQQRGLVTSKNAAKALRDIEARYEAAARDAAAYAGASIKASRNTQALSKSFGGLSTVTRGGAGGIQNVAFQVGDFATQVGAGTSASVALGQQLPQLLGGFGAVGAVAGALAAIGIPALSAAFSALGGEAASAEDAMDDLASMQSALESNTERLKLTVAELSEEYGEAARMVRGLSIAQGEALVAQAENRLKDELLILGDVVERYGEATRVIDEFGSTSVDISDSLRNLRKDLGVTSQGARTLFEAFNALNQAQGYEQQRDALAEVDRLLAAANVQASDLPPELNSALIVLRDMVFATEQLRNVMNEASDAAASIEFPQAPPPQPGFSFGGADFGRTVPGGGSAFVTTFGGDNENRPPSRGGGGGRSTPDRISALAKSLMTESELLESWRQESLAKLADFNALELEALGGHNEAKLRLEQEYQERLTAINDSERKARLDGIKGALGDASSLMQSGNEKLFKIGKAASLANAVINGYEAASEAWAKGMAVGGPPVAAAFTAASLARTGAMISSIQSQSINGGGGGASSAAGGTTAVAPAQAPLDVRLSGISPDTIVNGASIGDLLDRLSEEAGDRGYRILVAS